MNKPFMPKLVYFEPKALDYPLGKELFEKFSKMDVEIRHTTSHNQVRDLPGDNDFQKYRVAKSTLVVGVRKTLKFDTSSLQQSMQFLLRRDVWDIVIIVIYKQRWEVSLIYERM